MAITDLITRIEADATAEAADITGAAEAEVARIVGAAESTLDAERKATLAAAEYDAARDGATLLANARLAARDSLLAGKRAMAERVLARAEEALGVLPDAEYAELIAAGVARAAAGGETLAVAAADTKRLGGLAAALEKRGVKVAISAEPAPIARGALLTGDRMRVEVSPAAMVADRRDELLLVAARELFGGAD
ncbi:MAG: hypothetical protein EG823_04600 [Actinobacteria bacterium]|nr:hypothetical protein [Actinomycetota bacterium]